MSLQGMTSLPDFVSFKIFPGTPLEHIFSAAGDDLLELLQGFFTFNPLTRTTATQVINSVALLTHKDTYVIGYTFLRKLCLKPERLYISVCVVGMITSLRGSWFTFPPVPFSVAFVCPSQFNTGFPCIVCCVLGLLGIETRACRLVCHSLCIADLGSIPESSVLCFWFQKAQDLLIAVKAYCLNITW